jgi:hypothetical protein
MDRLRLGQKKTGTDCERDSLRQVRYTVYTETGTGLYRAKLRHEQTGVGTDENRDRL